MSIEIIPRESEGQWLAERRKRVTATDIGRLANGGPAARVAVKAEKLGGGGFRGNRYTRWGHEREPVILDHLHFLHDMQPNSALYVNGGRAATPDGLGLEGGELIALAEAKTTTLDWWTGTPAGTLAKLARHAQKYLDQVYWAQLVCDVDVTMLAWEPHHDFIPGEIRTLVIHRDEERITHLLEVEARFLDYWHGDERESEWTEFMARYAEAEQELKRAEAAIEDLKAEVREKGGDGEVSEATPFGNVSLKWPKATARLDGTALRAAHPDIAEEFTTLSAPKQQTLRITTK